MANVSLWSGVTVAMQSAIGAVQDVSGITKANPGVLTYVGADPTEDSYVRVDALGMSEVNARIFRANNVNAGGNTLELEGENTTNYGTFTSGSLYPLTLGTTIATLTGLNASGGDFDFIDTTTIHDLVKSNVPGQANSITFNFDSIWDVADAGLVALKAASDTKAQRAFLFTFANGQKLVFTGYVGASLLPTGQAGDKVTTAVSITMFGRPTVYSA